MIHVDEIASKVASFYEKIRGIVDWREEHLLRRTAIERALKRRLFLQKSGEEIAEPFVAELIRAGHFPNDRIEETKTDQVKAALNKYLFLLENSPAKKEKSRVELYAWLMDIAACEIEEILAPAIKERALIEYMTELMTQKIEVALSEEEKRNQVFIACQKALFKLDEAIITYYLLQKKHADWSNLPHSKLEMAAGNIYTIWEELERELHHPLAEKFYQVCEKYDTAYLILGDVVSENPVKARETLTKGEVLESSIRKFYQQRLQVTKTRMARAALFSTISIFITKILVALAIEVPFERYVWGQLDYQALGFNILIPPLLMFFLVLTIKPPKKENLDRVVMEAMKLVYAKDCKDVYLIKPAKKRGIILSAIIGAFYLFTFLLSFGAIVWILNKLNFGVLSMIIFLMFFSLIAFAGVKIRERAKELEIAEEKAGFVSFLMDSFSLPFLRVGKWLSHQWSKYNVVVILVAAFIDMPLQLFTEFLEHWRTFLKEKKEEIH